MPPILATSLLPPSQAMSLPEAAPNGVPAQLRIARGEKGPQSRGVVGTVIPALPLPRGHLSPKATSHSPAEGNLMLSPMPGASQAQDVVQAALADPTLPWTSFLRHWDRERNHPSQPPYLGVVRPTVVDIIEIPKIDRLHRLGAVSLKVRAGLGAGDENSSLWDHPPPIVLPDPVLLPSKQAHPVPNTCSEWLQGSCIVG